MNNPVFIPLLSCSVFKDTDNSCTFPCGMCNIIIVQSLWQQCRCLGADKIAENKMCYLTMLQKLSIIPIITALYTKT
jgi:hypothetical protein